MALGRVFRRSTFSFILSLYILSSSRVFISNVQQIGLSVNEGCFGNASKSVELVSLSLWGRRMPQFVRHLGIYVKGYHATRITRYPNSVTTFNQDRLATSGDISLNPGPDRIVSDNGKKPVWKFPCAVCDKPVRCNQKGILCNGCDSWHHIKCIDMDVETYVQISIPAHNDSSVTPTLRHND